ncbi:Bcr/CflA family efflux MFS transporter [Lysobacter panacisoli]|uniref:Bcr/CflA family efflux transporter n=1 Tax=Lysobacter panacisoli TaxID=1255263 RepID=A0ABP9LC83_9GAMM|nr:Bcr/CflA family efflux MFS transporter [Lysobacter panacisoli]
MRTESSPAVILLLAALTALAMLATNIVLPVMPAMIADLGASASAAAPVLWSFLAVFAVGQLFAGPLSDRFGRRPILFSGLAIFVAGSAIAASADGLTALLAGRALQGLGAAAASVLSRAVLRDLFEGAALARALGWVMSIMAAAPGFAPLLGALIGEAWGWRATLVALIAVAVVIAIAHQRIAGETLPATQRSRLGARALARGYAALLANPRFTRPALANALTMGALFAYFAATPVVLRGFGIGTVGIGLFFGVAVFAVFAASFRAPRLAARVGPARVIALGLSIAAVAAGIAVASTLSDAHGLIVYVVAAAVFLFGVGLIIPASTALTLGPFAAQAGQASALLGFLQMASATVALLVLPSIALPPAATLATIIAASALLARIALRPGREPLPAAA